MPLDDFTLDELRDRLRTEFGLDDVVAVNTVIDEKINLAQAWVIQRRPNWPWLRKKFVIDIPVAGSGTIDFTQDSRVASNPVGFTPEIRKVITTESSGSNPTTGYVIDLPYANPNATLDAAWTLATEAARSVRQVEHMFQLPDDFIRLEGPPVLIGADPDTTELRFVSPAQFRVLRYSQVPAILHDIYYTIERDPVDLEERKYLLVYPFIATRQTIRLMYYRDPPELVGDSDLSIMPRNARAALWWTAAWFVAQAENEEDTQLYSSNALQSIEAMAKESEFVDDTNEPDFLQSEPDFILPPPGYEDFNRG